MTWLPSSSEKGDGRLTWAVNAVPDFATVDVLNVVSGALLIVDVVVDVDDFALGAVHARFFVTCLIHDKVCTKASGEFCLAFSLSGNRDISVSQWRTIG